jgi:uncharacterized protein (TIGR03067 family)
MRLRVCVVAMALAGLGTAAEAAEVEGSWTAVRAERDGAPAAELVGHRLRFVGERYEIAGADGRPLYAGSYRVDATAEPARIDFINEAGEAAGVTWEGIYRLADGELTIVDDAPNPSAARPTTFTAAKGSGYVLVAFRR